MKTGAHGGVNIGAKNADVTGVQSGVRSGTQGGVESATGIKSAGQDRLYVRCHERRYGRRHVRCQE